MGVSFNEIPNNIRLPFFAVEFDNSNAVRGAQNQVYKTLLLGQKLPAGAEDVMKPVRVSGKADAIRKFGAGSHLAEMADYYTRIDPVTELFAIAVPDDNAGVRATATVTITGDAAEPGALYVYINAIRFTVPVKTGNTPDAVTAAFAAAVNQTPGLPVDAAVAGGKVVVSAKHPGQAGNELDIRINYQSGEFTPAGLGIAITPFAGGAVNPDVTDALGLVMGEWFNAVASPYTDANNLYVINEELKRRWGAMIMQEGTHFAARRGTFGELCDFGQSRNSQHECILHCNGIPNSPWAVAASVAACAMYYGNIDPARPFQTLPLVGILPPLIEERFGDFPENNQLLYNGISNFTVDAGGIVRIGRLITTYKTTANGAEDISYLDLNTILTLGYLRWDLRNYFLRKYPRHKLADDGNQYDAGQAIMTPKLAKAECINKFIDWMRRGLVENIEQFKRELIVERNASDPNRLDFILPPDLINQFIVGAAKILFYL